MIAILVALLALQLATQPVALAPTSLIRAGTPVAFVTESVIDSRTVRQGQRFTIIVVDDVIVGDKPLILKGTRAIGEVEAVTGKGMFGKPGTLALRPLFVELGGQRIYFDGLTEQRGKEQVGGAAVATFAAGAFGLIITGKSATLPAGSRLEGRVRSDVTIGPAIR